MYSWPFRDPGKFMDEAKKKEEHKENVPPFSMGDEAEPRV